MSLADVCVCLCVRWVKSEQHLRRKPGYRKAMRVRDEGTESWENSKGLYTLSGMLGRTSRFAAKIRERH